MESLLLTGTVFAVILIAYRVFRSERPGGEPGLGLFGYKETMSRPQTPKDRGHA